MTTEELKERQSWTTVKKIDHALGVIDQFNSRLNGMVYVSFSGGKDSTVLLHLCRIINKDIKAVFCNTGNEYPEIIRFVKKTRDQGANIEIIRPKMMPREVVETYGFPVISKEMCQKINVVRDKPESKTAIRAMTLMVPRSDGNGFVHNRFSIPAKYMPLLRSNYPVSDMCCHKLKKEPFREFEKATGLSPIIGTMASESVTRQSAYIKRGGCNTFIEDGKNDNTSMPLSIWSNDDIWWYIKDRGIEISEIYEKGLDRTGCAFCGFGAQNRDDKRFAILQSLYPKWYEMCMNYTCNGITYKEVLNEVLRANNNELL